MTDDPPAPDADPIKPMSLVGAALLAVGAQMLFLLLLSLFSSGEEGHSHDLVTATVCQIAGYVLALFAMLRVWAPEASIRQVVGAKRSTPLFYGLALGLGFAATWPTNWLYNRIIEQWPRSETPFGVEELFFALDMPERIAVAIGAVFFGPLVEELLFRGAMFTALRKSQDASLTIAFTAMMFAAVHLVPQSFPWLFLMGLVLGYVRHASGSVIPALLLHMVFNGMSILDLFSRDAPRPQSEIVEVPTHELFFAIAGCAVLLAVMRAIRVNTQP